MQKILALLFIIMLIYVPAAVADDYPSIVCTSFPCYDFARAVSGEFAECSLLIKPGTEVHTYEPTPADVMRIAECDLFIYIGGESDAWVEDILDSFGNEAPETLRLFDCVEAIKTDHEQEHVHSEYDEHIWTNPKNAVLMVNAVCDKLYQQDMYSDYMESYRANADIYIEQIQSIDAEIEACVANASRNLMIFADRFPFLYFAREYGIEYVSAFPSCSSESEPSAKTMMEMIDRVIKEKIPVIYTIELSTGKTAQTIAAETGAKVLTFHSVQNVSEAEFSAGENYVSLMRRNVAALQEGLN